MDVPNQYCGVRSSIEERICILTANLFALNERLCTLAGIDHQEFLATRDACCKVTNELSKSRYCLEVHRIAHRC